jgi:CHAT domain-containing protein
MDELFDLGPSEKTVFVALSACQSALDPDLSNINWGSRGDGEGEGAPLSASGPVTSAAHTLLLVGIPAVTATLWMIDDQATALLMTEFYRGLKETHNVYRAFRQAQLNMMNRKDTYSQPYYWAAFIYYGLQR